MLAAGHRLVTRLPAAEETRVPVDSAAPRRLHDHALRSCRVEAPANAEAGQIIIGYEADADESKYCILVLRHGADYRVARVERGIIRPPASPSSLPPSSTASRHRHQVVVLDDGPSLVTRIGRPDAQTGVFVLGASPEGAFYTAEERRLLSLMLGSVAPKLSGVTPQ